MWWDFFLFLLSRLWFHVFRRKKHADDAEFADYEYEIWEQILPSNDKI